MLGGNQGRESRNTAAQQRLKTRAGWMRSRVLRSMAMMSVMSATTLGVSVGGSVAESTSVRAEAPTALTVEVRRERCETFIEGGIGYANATGRFPDQYRKVGTSVLGTTIWAEHWGAKTGPQVLVVGQVHGNECSMAWVVRELRLHPGVTFGVWIIATLNPDGASVQSRRNANNVDLNRDGFKQSQPETKALLAFTRAIRPTLTVHLHSPLGWVGAYNGGVADTAARAIAKLAGWSAGMGSGSGRGYLWEGQALVHTGHPSILVELPGVSRFEAPNTPKRPKDVSLIEIERLARAVRTGLEQTFSPALYQRRGGR